MFRWVNLSVQVPATLGSPLIGRGSERVPHGPRVGLRAMIGVQDDGELLLAARPEARPGT